MTKTAKTAKTMADIGIEPIVEAANNTQIPAAIADYAQRFAKAAEARVESVNENVGKATSMLESAVSGSATNLAEVSRNVQGAIYDDVKASLAAVEKIAAAGTLSEAAKIHVEFLNERGQVGLARVKSISDYLAKTLQTGAKQAQDALAKFAGKSDQAA